MVRSTKPESRIVSEIREALITAGFWVLKVHGGAFQTAGIPDLLAIVNGRAFWFEVKRPGEKATPLQAHMIGRLRDAGCRCAVVDNVNDALRLAKSWEGEG